MSDDGMVFWPHEPPDDAVVLIRVVGTTNIDKVRKALEETDIPFTMGGRRKDDLNFYVPEGRKDEAKREVQKRMR